jgi:glycogen(starch) synthase
MRILIWTDAFWPEIGGMEIFCMRLVLALKERDHECLVITERRHLQDEGLRQFHGVPVHGVRFYAAGGSGKLPALRRHHELCTRVIDEFAPDVLHLNSVIRGALGFVLQQRRQRRPAVLTLHDHFRFPDRRGLAPAVLENVNRIVAISESVKADALSYEATLNPKLRVVLNAMPEPSVSPAPLPATPRLLCVGRLVAEKGFDQAVLAFGRLAHRFPDATLTLAGDGSDRARVEKLADESGVSDRIHFRGWIDPEAIPALINEHSVVLMPSRWREPFGLVLLQAAQMARPVVASRIGGIPEIVVDGVTGHLFESENVADFVARLEPLLENPRLAVRLGLQARAHVQAHFRYEDFLASYERCYGEAASQTRWSRCPQSIG